MSFSFYGRDKCPAPVVEQTGEAFIDLASEPHTLVASGAPYKVVEAEPGKAEEGKSEGSATNLANGGRYIFHYIFTLTTKEMLKSIPPECKYNEVNPDKTECNYEQEFTVRGNAPSEDENIGQGGPGSNQEHACTPKPVDCATGEEFVNQTDLSVGGRGPALQARRAYSSLVASKAKEAGPLGYGWSAPYSTHLAIEPKAETVTVVAENGSAEIFAFIKEHEEGGTKIAASYEAPEWVQSKLEPSGSSYIYTLPDQTQLEFNSEGRLVKEVDRNGNAITFAYKSGGTHALEAATDSAARKLTFSYNGEGEIEKIKDPMGREVKYAYKSGNLSEVTEPGESKANWTFEYDSEHQLTKETDGRGHSTTMKYKEHRVESQTDALERKRSFSYKETESRPETIITEPNGSKTREQFNLADEPTKVTRAYEATEASTSEYTYNAALQRAKVTDPNKHVTEYGYDAAGDKTSEKNADGDETKWEYNATHDVIAITTPKGEKTTIKRDSHGNVEAIERPAPSTATFGKTTSTGTGTTLLPNKLSATIFDKPEAGKVKRLLVWVEPGTKAGAKATLKAVIYAKSGSEAGAKLVEGTAVSYVQSEAAKWLELPLPATELAAGEYYIGFLLRGEEKAATFTYENATIGQHRFHEWTSETAPANFKGAGEEAFDERQFSLYAEYSPTAPLTTAKFGKTTTTGTGVTLLPKKLSATLFSKPEAGKVKRLWVWVEPGTKEGAKATLKAIVYAKSGTEAGAKLAEGTAVSYVQSEAAKWLELPLSETELSAGEYYIGFLLRGEEQAVKFTYEGSLTSNHVYHEWAGETAPASFKEAGETFDEKDFSLYAEYTPAVLPSGTQTTKYKYKTNGDLESVEDPLKRLTKYEYDSYGDRTAEEDPEKDKRTLGFNEDSQETSTISPRGHAEGAEEAKFKTTIERDEQGRVKKVTDPLGDETKYSYDPDGNLETLTDPKGNRTTYTYDADNELTTVEAPNKTTTETEYDSAGDVVAQIDANKHTTKYKRNLLEEVTEVEDPLKRKTTKAYDNAGNLTELTDALKRTTKYKYDAANRLTEVTYSDGKTHSVKYEYDKDGDRTKMEDATGTTKYEYDQLDRLIETENGHGEGVKYEYDVANELTGLTYPNGRVAKREYDGAGRLKAVRDWSGNTTKFAYDQDSDVKATTFPSGTGDEDTYSYNDADQMSEVKMAKGAETLASLAYTRDKNGQVEKTTSKGLPGEEKLTYAYDEDNRLKEGAGTAYAYDSANNPTKIGSGTYKYDSADELESGPGVTYEYNEVGERIKNKPSSGPATSYGYDEAGNLILVERAKEGEISEIKDSYVYDGTGLRGSQTISGTTSYFAWDVAEELPLILTDGANSYIYGPGGLPVEQISSGGTVTYLHHDQQGSTRLLTGAGGTVTGSTTFDGYGRQTASTGTATTPLGYDGQYTNSDTGLIYLRAREYDPATAQFTSVDSLTALTGTPYAYAADNPLGRGDPTGLLSKEKTLSILSDLFSIGTTLACIDPFAVGICDAAIAVNTVAQGLFIGLSERSGNTKVALELLNVLLVPAEASFFTIDVILAAPGEDAPEVLKKFLDLLGALTTNLPSQLEPECE